MTGITCLICSTFLMCGSTRAFTAYLMAQLTQEGSVIRMNENEASWLGCLPSMWNPVGFVLGGFTMDAFGRKWSTIMVFVPFIVGWAVIVNARSLSAIYVGVALHGVASGMTMTSTVYVSEITPAEYRGFSLSLLGLWYMLGTVVCSILQCLVTWVYTAACFFVLSILMLGATYSVPESPYWLIMRGRIHDATKVLILLRKPGSSGREASSSCGYEKSAKIRSAVQREILDIKQCVEVNSGVHRQQNRIHDHELSLAVVTVDDQTIGNSKSSGGISLLLAAEATWCGVRDTIFALRSVWKQMSILIVFAILHKLTGYTPLAQYTVAFFKELNPPINTDIASLIHFIVCLASTFAVPYFVHHYDRRLLLSVTSAVAGCGMSVTLLHQLMFCSDDRQSSQSHSWMPLIGVYTYDAASTLGITSILVMLPAELLPTEISSTASVVFSITCSVATSLISKTYLAVFASIGLVGLLSVFVSSCFLVALLAIFMLPETRGKTLHEIQRIYFIKKSTGSTSTNDSTSSISIQCR